MAARVSSSQMRAAISEAEARIRREAMPKGPSVRRRTQVPESSTAAGTVGDVAQDGEWLYICVEANTWRRVALEAW